MREQELFFWASRGGVFPKRDHVLVLVDEFLSSRIGTVKTPPREDLPVFFGSLCLRERKWILSCWGFYDLVRIPEWYCRPKGGVWTYHAGVIFLKGGGRENGRALSPGEQSTSAIGLSVSLSAFRADWNGYYSAEKMRKSIYCFGFFPTRVDSKLLVESSVPVVVETSHLTGTSLLKWLVLPLKTNLLIIAHTVADTTSMGSVMNFE